jgi:hypothetical protein
MRVVERVVRSSLLVAAGLVARPAAALAAGHTCELGEPGLIEVDGALDDWRGLRAFRQGPAGDAEVSIRCASDARHLYLLVEVGDDEVVRTRAASARGEDSVTVSLAASSAARPLALRVFPETPTGRRRLTGVPGWIRVEDGLTARGYAIEVAVPLARLPGYGRSTPVLLAEVLAHDADRPTAMRIETVAGLRGRLHFSPHVEAYRAFLATTRLKAAELTIDELVDLDASPGTERVVAGGRFLGVLGDGFGFVELPATSAADVLSVKVLDPSAMGRPMVLSHTRQRGSNGSRELLIWWRVDGTGQLARALALEVAQELDGRSIRNRWSLVPAGSARRAGRRPRRGALELRVEVTPEDVLGWDAAAYARVQPSADATPVMTPWAERTSVVYWFDGNAVLGPEPVTQARRRR